MAKKKDNSMLIFGLVAVAIVLLSRGSGTTAENSVVITMYDQDNVKVGDKTFLFAAGDVTADVKYLDLKVNVDNSGDTEVDYILKSATLDKESLVPLFTIQRHKLAPGEGKEIASSQKFDISRYGDNVIKRLTIEIEGQYVEGSGIETFTKEFIIYIVYDHGDVSFQSVQDVSSKYVVCGGVVCDFAHCGNDQTEVGTSYYQPDSCDANNECVYKVTTNADQCTAELPDITYPTVKSTYDYETFHMVHANNILDRRPDGYVDDKYFINGRPWSFVEANLIFYDERKEDRFLDLAITALEKVYSRASDSDGDGLLDFKGYYVLDNADTVHAEGHIASMFTDAIHIIRKHQVSKYYANADKYEILIEQHMIPHMLTFWRAYTADGVDMGYWVSTNLPTTARPYNQGAEATRAILVRGLDTNNDLYKDIGQRYINRFFDQNPITLYNNTEYLSAYYYIYDERSGETFFSTVYAGKTDIDHINIEFGLLLTGYENRMVSDAQFTKIINALRFMRMIGRVDTRDGPLFYEEMQPPRQMWPDETNNNKFQQSGIMYSLIRFGIIAPDLVYSYEEILRNIEIDGQLQGNYYSTYYRCIKDPRYDYLEFCNPDDNAWQYKVEDMSILLGIANLGKFQ